MHPFEPRTAASRPCPSALRPVGAKGRGAAAHAIAGRVGDGRRWSNVSLWLQRCVGDEELVVCAFRSLEFSSLDLLPEIPLVSVPMDCFIG